MRKHDVDSINLKIEEVEPCFGGIVISWSSDIGFGQYTIYRKPVPEHPECVRWFADSECMDDLEDKAFGKKLLQLWMDQILVVT